MISGRNPIREIELAISACTASPDAEVSEIYLALARTMWRSANEDLKALERVIRAREKEMIRQHGLLVAGATIEGGEK